ncbi:MAG: hypothetical protein R2750_14390 [Bacteroidales bacterium]
MKFKLRESLKFFDYKIGLAGGLVMGIIVFIINYRMAGDVAGSFTAALKQGVYTFFFGGTIMRLCEIIAIKLNPAFWAVFLAMLIPSFISLVLTYGVHSLKGTPKPIESTIPTAIFVIPSTFIWGYLKRMKITIK